MQDYYLNQEFRVFRGSEFLVCDTFCDPITNADPQFSFSGGPINLPYTIPVEKAPKFFDELNIILDGLVVTTGTQADGEVTFQLPENTGLNTYDLEIQYIKDGVELIAGNSSPEPFAVEEPQLLYHGFTYSNDEKSSITL